MMAKSDATTAPRHLREDINTSYLKGRLLKSKSKRWYNGFRGYNDDLRPNPASRNRWSESQLV
jgi:hypothetical protein